MDDIKTVLVCGIGGPTPRSIAKTLRRSRPDLKIIGVDSNPKALGFFVDGLIDYGIVIPRATEENYWPTILKLIDDYNVDAAFVMPELEVARWGEYFEVNGQLPCKVLLPPVCHTHVLADKARMAELLCETDYIPKTCLICNGEYSKHEVIERIGFPCWIRASKGSGGLGALRIDRLEDLDMWLFINRSIPEFTLSEYLPGRHIANQMMFIDGNCLKSAGVHCVEYVMADIAPSKVTGNTSFGQFLNESSLLNFCDEVMDYIQRKTGVNANGVYSFDIKEDQNGKPKVTEINIRHMAYTGIMASVGFDLITDTLLYFENKTDRIVTGHYRFPEEMKFLRDVDVEPILVRDFERANPAQLN